MADSVTAVKNPAFPDGVMDYSPYLTADWIGKVEVYSHEAARER
jgi:hypothetical protein